MKEIKILAIVVVIIGVIYWGVEPLAHGVMHPKGAPIDFEFKDLDKLGSINLADGDPNKGKETFANTCTACHGIKSQGIEPPIISVDANTAGVVPPDLSHSALVFDHKFLAHFIKFPVRSTLLEHKFAASCEHLEGDAAVACESSNNSKEGYSMPGASDLGLEDSDVSDIVAYLVSIAPSKISDKEVFIQACARCHGVDYDKGQYDGIFDSNAQSKYGTPLKSLTPHSSIQAYMGATPPDLSMVIRSYGKDNLNTFLNNPQNVPLDSVKKAIIDKLTLNAKNEAKAKLTNLSVEERIKQEKIIDLKESKDFNIQLPKNISKDAWQKEENYINMAKEMGVMPTGKSMPRVGLSQKAQEQVISYLEQIGDSKKAEREYIILWVMGFFIVISIFAFIWKRKIWKDLH